VTRSVAPPPPARPLIAANPFTKTESASAAATPSTTTPTSQRDHRLDQQSAQRPAFAGRARGVPMPKALRQNLDAVARELNVAPLE
jgi:hypothetical protein